jgi:Winged helix-turn helix
MVKCNADQVRRLQRALKREKSAKTRQRIQLVLLRESGMTQPEIADATGVSLSTVNRAHMAYDHGGRAALGPERLLPRKVRRQQVFFRILYGNKGGIEVRQAALICTLNANGKIVAAKPT